MTEKIFAGIDTSNYTTSLAIVGENGAVLYNFKLPLSVKKGEDGLRQRDAVFAHIKNLCLISEKIKELLQSKEISAIGYSATPRDTVNSYMPCFLVGETVAKMLFAFLDNVPVLKFSHQSGHIRAAVYSSGALTKEDFIAFHVSGGTTEILHVENIESGYKIEIIGGSKDLNAGQAIDRIGVLMGFDFPCGKEMERMAFFNNKKLFKPKICVNGLTCNLSGLENMASKIYEETKDIAYVSAFVLDFIGKTLEDLSYNVRLRFANKKIIYAGGVTSNLIIQQRLKSVFDNVYFASPEFSTDNAAGIALLARDRYLNSNKH